MQLKWKKIGIISTVIMYFATFLMQSNLEFFRVWAGESNKPRVNIVAILVDDKIYNSISGDLSWYAGYVQNKLAETKALVMPLHLSTVSAYDIHRMLENIYFDGLEDVNSSLIGLIMVGEVPLPVVNQDGYVFPTVYPYVDFEDQKYVRDREIKYFVPNGNSAGQAEVWHGLINYGSDIGAYTRFFDKIRKYSTDSDGFIGDAMWYEDFIADKEGFLNENYQYYRNKMMFSEDLGYQRYSPLMKSLFNGETTDNGLNIVEELKDAIGGDVEPEWASFEMPKQGTQDKHTTKMVQQEIQDSYLADYNDLFSKVELTTKRENVFAGGRWIKVYEDEDGVKSMETDADSSALMIQLKDTLYMGNDDLVGVIQNLNNILERFVDKKIEDEKYSMDIVLPVEYKKVTGKRAYIRCYPFVTRYENYYFGTNARYVDNVNDLSIYRGTYRNLEGIDGLQYSDLTGVLNPSISDYDKTDITKKSIGASYDIFSNQVDGNRGYMMLKFEDDSDEYMDNQTRAQDKEKTTCVRGLCTVRRKSWPSKCGKGKKDRCETLGEFASRWRGGASVINLDLGSVSEGRYKLTSFLATDSWRPIFDMGGYQSLLSGKDEGMSGTGWIVGEGVGPQWEATNYKSYIKYSSPTEVEGWNRARWGFRIFENHLPNVHNIGFNDMNYWDLSLNTIASWNFKQESEKYFSIEHKNKKSGFKCSGSEKYTYKFISSVVKHDSTTDEEINGVERDLYGESGKLGKYYADVELVYSGLYQDTQNVIASGKDFLESLNERGESFSGYKQEFINAFSGLDNLLNDSIDDSAQEGKIREEVSKIESKIPGTLSGVEDILSGSRNDFMELYMDISSLFSDNILGVFERILYVEGGDPNVFSEGGSVDVKVPFLSSWISNINTIKQSIVDTNDSLLEAYDNAYSSLSDFRNQWIDFYSRYENVISKLTSFEERFFALDSGFNNIFIWDVEKEEDDSEIVDEAGDEDVELEEEVSFIELTGGSVSGVVADFINGFTETHKLFGQIFQVDQRGSKIIIEAARDEDFKARAKENGIKIGDLSQSELITEYAKWAEGDGYDSDGAIKNHELLVGVVEHMSGMNILTPDRPIDSPRYVSMQSIEGKDINLIYPDLFKVEVFELTGGNDGYDHHILLTKKEIKEKLIEYIKNKVSEYNNILDVPESQVNTYYYRKILPFDKYATPYKSQRPYKPFKYEEFIDALGGEGMLDVISDILYYQNLTNKNKITTGDISEDIKFIKKSFNINDKRENVLEEYLTEGMEKEKHPMLVIPKYEFSGYEVAYVNSDGWDYIFPAESESGDLSEVDENPVTVKFNRIQPTNQEQDLKDKCGIPRDGKLPIFKLEGLKPTSPWIDGFACWLRETWRTPAKLKLSFAGSLGEKFLGNGIDGYVEEDDIENTTEWKDSNTQTTDPWESLIESGTGFDADKVIGELELKAEKHNREVLGENNGESNALMNANNSIKISNSNAILSDNNPSSLLEISSIYDVGNITLIIEGTGDGCLKLDEAVVCGGSKFSKVFNPKIQPFTGIVTSADHKAGASAFDIKYSLGGEYIEEVIKYSVSPSLLASVDIKLGDKKTIAGMITPVEVKGFDKYNNEVSWGLRNYDFKVSQGKFLKDGAFMSGFTTNDFRNLRFYYQAPLDAEDGSEAQIEIVESSEFDSIGGDVLGLYRQPLVQGAPEVRLNDEIILEGDQIERDWEYKLGTEETIYKANAELDVSKLQRLDLYMKDKRGNIIDVDSQITVTSQNGLVVIGQVQKNDEGKDVFFTTSMHYLSGGHVVVYYYPTKVSGKDVIEIEIPGLESRVINLLIHPSTLSKIQFKPADKILQIGDEMEVEAFLMDKWGNLIDNDGMVAIYYEEEKVKLPGGIDGVLVTPYTQGYAKFTAIGVGGGITDISSKYGSVSIMVDKHLFPSKGLNILYLNYFGSDRGNQWGYFSNNDNYIEEVMDNSNKIITTTTQIVSEDKIKKMIWKIQPGFQIRNPGNEKTLLTFHGNSFDMVIGEVSNMQDSLPSFERRTLTQEAMQSILFKSPGNNYAFFISNDSNYWIKNGILYSGDEKLGSEKIGSIVDGDITLQLDGSSLDNGDNIWMLMSKGKSYGSVVFHMPDFMPNAGKFVKGGDRYLISPTFTDGSTYSLSSLGFFDEQSDFELDTSYKSIQNSDELKEQIGFLGDFKNITLFAEGEIVGEATRKFGSEFVINLGDPVLSRKSDNDNVYGTDYDGGIGQEIYSDSEDEIFGTYLIDFNNDGLKDLLVIYLNGSVKLAKNYGGTPDLRNMQELMRIAVSVQDVFIGDVDGNGYEDIIIRTSNNQLRVYKNYGGEFDVDGNLACLNINVSNGEKPEDPTDVSGLYQLDVEDMDRDGKTDIITYDYKGYVKVFYGGKTYGYDNYLSKDKYGCDTGWYNREAKNTAIVAQLGLQIANGEKIFDNSMLRRVGMNESPLVIQKGDLKDYGITFDEDTLEGMIGAKESWPSDRKESNISGAITEVLEGTDVDMLSQKGMEEMKRREVTLYENKLVGGDGSNVYTFSPLSFLEQACSGDKAYAYKTYSYDGESLKDGDKVKVTVNIVAKEPVVLTFGDIIQGPWRLYFDDENYFKGLKISQGKNVQLKKRDGNFAYLLDNISLGGGETFSYSYELEYVSLKLKDISLSYDASWYAPYSNDNYPDIKVQSTDGCEKDFNAFLNMGSKRSFLNKKIELQKMIDSIYSDTEIESYDFGNDVSTSSASTVNERPGMVGDSMYRIELLSPGTLQVNEAGGEGGWKEALLEKIQEGGLESLNVDMNIDLSIFEEQVEDIENYVDEITKGLCEGYSFGGSNNCEGLPVPFNQAFFAPGKYHLFGCWELPLPKLEEGLPVFFYPGTSPASRLPIPNGLKSPMDSFLWVPGGQYPSVIRIYVAPTLTAQIGIAICMSPERIWKKVPSPLADVAGNCMVFAVKPKCKGNKTKEDKENPNEIFPEIVEDVRDSKTCSQSEKGVQITRLHHRSSPFNMVGSLFGVVELEYEAFIGPADGNENSIMIGDVEILGGNYDVNKIKGGIQQGVRKLLIDKRLDPQIRYILNQLTKMHVNIKLPNISNLVGNEVSVFNNIAQNFKNEMADRKEIQESKKVTAWKRNAQEKLDDFSQTIANPFESLASLMNQSNIINITTEPLVVKVPMIMNDDIASYSLYLQQWVDENKSILNERTTVINSLAGSCSKRTLEKAQEICAGKDESCVKTNHSILEQQCLKEANEYRQSLIEFQSTDWKKMENQIYTNLLILQEYRNFPFEMYEWIHAIDRYMSEIASLISNTIGYLSYWTSTNAERFVGYVDAIVLMLNIIKTYQLIIDFSVEWSENCGNCAKDTYDQYSCKLSLLCDTLQLPIIQIPNFKLPNITIDLTDINLGLDIVLPEFNFQTVRIDLPDLPNLPHPPVIGANIRLFDLPNIPQLPEPPHLPELPSFIPEIDVELPILPPAPELPKLPNQIESLIKVSELIGKIYCIVKGGFGLVGESSVKAKIEQLTQRTYTVDRIDNIIDFTNRTAAPIKNYGVDYEISSHIDIQFNLSDFYDFLDVITNDINNLTTDVVDNWVQKPINKAADSVYGAVENVTDVVDNQSIKVDVQLFGSDGLIKTSMLPGNDIKGLTTDEIEYVDYSEAKDRLQDVLAYFKKEGRNTTLSNKLNQAIGKIENQIGTPNVIVSNTEGINQVKNQALEYIENRKSEYSDLADMINNDYDGFLAMIDSESAGSGTKSGLNSGKMITFNVNLFNLDSSAEENLKKIKGENPYELLLGNKQDIVNGYRDAVNKNTAEDLGLTQKQYIVLRDGIKRMKLQLSNLYSVTRQEYSTNLVAKNGGVNSNSTLLASANAAVIDVPKKVKQLSVDPAGLADGIYEKIVSGPDKGKVTKIIYSDSFVSSIGDNYYKTNPGPGHDIIMWTEDAIYKKCSNQVCGGDGVHYGGTYMLSKSIDEVPYQEKWVNFGSSTKLKIADGDQEVKNWEVKGQTYDSFNLSWKIENVDAYLIKLVTRIDTSYEKSDRKGDAARYILALPNKVSEDDLIDNKYKLELLNKTNLISSLLGSNQVVEVVHYDENKSIASVIVTGPEERKRYYANIATLKLNDKTYNINSPWSNQVVAGKQIVGDDQEPSSEPNLYRIKTDEIVSEGDDLDGYVGTNYTLNVPWKDNVALSYINISKDGKILDQKYTDKPEDVVKVEGIFRTESQKEVYKSVGIDQFGNKTEKVITVAYYIPDITVTNISKNQDGESVSIIAELSHDIDQGNVSFQRRRGEQWKTMKRKGVECADLAISPKQTIISGSPYSMGNKIAFYDTNDAVIALVDSQTAEINLQSGYKDSYEIKVGVGNSTTIKVCNKQTNKSVFILSLPIQELVGIEADGYTIVDLPEKGNMGMYNGGKAVYKDGNVILLISPTGYLYSDFSLEGTYKYDRELQAIEFTLYQGSDLDNSSPIKVRVKVKPFEMR